MRRAAYEAFALNRVELPSQQFAEKGRCSGNGSAYLRMDVESSSKGGGEASEQARARFLDWFFVVVVLAGGTIALSKWASPRIVEINIGADAYGAKKNGEIVPTYALGILAVLLPGALFCVLEFGLMRTPRVFFGVLSTFFLGVAESAGLTLLITTGLKLIVGRPRPFFRQICGEFVPNTFKCTGDPAAVADARKSFPSGHSSLSFAVFVYVALYMATRMRLSSVETRFKSIKLTLIFVPVFIAALVAVSRVLDFHHNYSDIVAGSALGACIAATVWSARSAHFQQALRNSDDNLPLTTPSHSSYLAGEGAL